MLCCLLLTGAAAVPTTNNPRLTSWYRGPCHHPRLHRLDFLLTGAAAVPTITKSGVLVSHLHVTCCTCTLHTASHSHSQLGYSPKVLQRKTSHELSIEAPGPNRHICTIGCKSQLLTVHTLAQTTQSPRTQKNTGSYPHTAVTPTQILPYDLHSLSCCLCRQKPRASKAVRSRTGRGGCPSTPQATCTTPLTCCAAASAGPSAWPSWSRSWQLPGPKPSCRSLPYCITL